MNEPIYSGQYVASGWLEQPARGVFRRPQGTVSWEQVVISLQTMMGFPVSVGGLSALELQGYAHYLPQVHSAIHLYTDKKVPGWVLKIPIDPSFTLHNRLRLFPPITMPPDTLSLTEPVREDEVALEGALRMIPWGHWQWPLVVSTPERAYLELLDELSHNETFHMADMLMEGLVNLSPRRLQALLESAGSVKVKRLFFFFADRHQHRWLDRIDRNKIDLGKGKRMLVKGGKFDRKYQITVPDIYGEGA